MIVFCVRLSNRCKFTSASEKQQNLLFFVAQRVGTIMHADRIVVLNEGDVVGIGTHRELLETCPIYYDIAASQLSEEELA